MALTLERREDLSRRIERVIEVPMLTLAVIFLLATALPELLELSEQADDTLEAVNLAIWVVFALELGVRTYLASDRRNYLTTHWIDVLAVAFPFLRPLRLLRVVVVTARLWRTARVVIRQHTFALILITALTSACVGAALVYAVEHGAGGPIRTFPDALWWAASTLTTVGYGDVYPTTAAGRGVAVVLMLLGIGLFGLLTARVAAFFVEDEARPTDTKLLREIVERLDRIEHQRSE